MLLRLVLFLLALFAVLFVIRLLIMVPLYLAGQVALLGVAKVVLGWPLWLAGVAVMGLMLVKGHTAPELDPSDDADEPEDSDHSSLRGTR